MYLTLSNNFFGSCGSRVASILIVRRSDQIISGRKVRFEGRASPPASLYESFLDDPIASAWVGGAEKKELVIDFVATKRSELWELDIFKQGIQAFSFSFLIFFTGPPSETSEKINCKMLLQREVSTLSWVGRLLKGDGGNTKEERQKWGRLSKGLSQGI